VKISRDLANLATNKLQVIMSLVELRDANGAIQAIHDLSKTLNRHVEDEEPRDVDHRQL